ncbi:Verru_Chthon cassette protein A [Terrimicrobium sacchariphilum]|uniref:Verru_Chthon cassette protein A n=1 Tax=Terrimicrobium sacchariphilum TaxID=690879 RepID=UPI0009467A35|nr:Verru_Chthon cassette protein A [Terrimicrobium sacchariphilum]
MNQPSRTRGFALVITLLLIVLVAIFITATLSTVGTDTQATDANASADNAMRLANVAVQTVISQLQEATTQGPSTAWASQPGMIRCYDNQGQETTWFKLYSAQKMIQSSPGSAGLSQLTADLPTGTWEGGGVFTDLNSPVLSADGNTKLYPIMDPIGAKFSNNSSKAIPGFDIDQSARPSGSNTAPMPVRWLYVLRDGTLVPGEGGGSSGSIKVDGASKSNPIVGRIAFWADDETCKLNINTAADGTYFDSPRFDSALPVKSPTAAQAIGDRQFAVTPPAAREFQRYIGHPAQTRLSTVIPDLAPASPFVRSRAITGVTPFLQWGGSQGGTVTFWDLAGKLEDPATMASPARATPYTTLDEWIFSQNASGGKRSLNTYVEQGGAQKQLVTRSDLNRLQFVLTASSEAPEINLFGKPRIAMWPIHNDFLSNATSAYATRFDRMIASAATLNAASSKPASYFFTRADSTSPTSDYENISRNKELFGYLRRLSGTEIPGFGNNFVAKYTRPGMDQILTEIFDYIRSTNVTDAMLFGTTPATDHTYTKFRQETAPLSSFSSPVRSYDMGRGQVTPIYISEFGTKGFGRFHSISEVAINIGVSKDTTVVDNPTIVPAIYINLFSPSMGPPILYPNMRVQIDTADLLGLKLSVNGTEKPLFSAPAAGSVFSSVPKAVRWHNGSWFPFFWGGAAGPRPMFVEKASGDTSTYAFRGNDILVNKDDKLSFTGGTLHLKIFWADQVGEGKAGNPGYLVQEMTVTLPPFSNLSVPVKNKSRFDYRLFDAFFGSGNNADYPIVDTTDITRSAVATFNGDLRLVSALRTVPDSTFVHPSGLDETKQSLHSMREAFPNTGFKVSTGFNSPGQLVKGVTYGDFLPITGLVSDPNGPDSTGDWDNGLGIIPDGPYINKPDEVGMQYFLDTWTGNKDTYTYYMQGDSGLLTDARGYSSPNRNLASPVMFGSLSTGVPVGGMTAVPWRTLLFRPQRNHFGQTTDPKDYLMLDWFWMPVVEPYAISTTFATEGKVNMNYQLAPFTYVTRATALIGTLGSEYVIAVPTTDAGKYKSRTTSGNPSLNYRNPVKVLESDGVTAGESTGSLRQFKALFDKGEIFRSAAQICGIYLVPSNQSWTSDSDAETFWGNNKLTGDNTRERPYNGLYSRLTTKSNTFTVHVRVQVLKPDPNGADGVWTENAKRIASEYRGSYTINRYLDREQDLPDFANAANFDKSIEGYYRYRVTETRRFQP